MTETSRRLNAALLAGAVQVEHCDVPLDMTLGEWRRHCAEQNRATPQDAEPGTKRRGLRRLLGR